MNECQLVGRENGEVIVPTHDLTDVTSQSLSEVEERAEILNILYSVLTKNARSVKFENNT